MHNESATPNPLTDDDEFLNTVRDGLCLRPKSIPPKFFYDAQGSHLFDLICTTPEYYPTRTETGILEAFGEQMATLIGTSSNVIELGSGSATKTPLLLKHLKNDAAYTPVDICEPHLMQSTQRLQALFPSLQMKPVHADYTCMPSLELDDIDSKRQVVFFPGSTIGNSTPQEALDLLGQMAHLVGEDGAMLIGVDNKKSPEILNAAYNDASGHTAAFNLNLLGRMQRELGAELDENGFEHYAYYNADIGRIEMHLVSKHKQHIRLDGDSFQFEPGETIHTENSYKYTPQEFHELSRQAGWHPKMEWSDSESLFNIHYMSLSASEPRHLPQKKR
ncbi:MAG: L-histidine N(alpha)-methyltransferase [Gallionella sp.]